MVRIGMFLGGRYEILEKVGSGGMSEVYKAKDHKLNRLVAIKVLKQEFNADSSFVSKFQMEAQSAACLSHQNVVSIYDVGKEENSHYIVMELVEGITLKDFIQKKGKLDIRESIGVAMQVAQAIEAAHEQNIVHRDIKPQNIMISRDGKVKVTDFGIARAASTQTISSNTMGSVHYISPEQARGGYCDERSDIYSLGITLYEMLTGRLPFEGDNTVSIALQHIQGEMVPPSEFEKMIPVSLEKIILKCTQKKPEQRYATATALITDLKKALMTPEEDFVKVIPLTNDNPTIIMSDEDVAKIKGNAKSPASEEEVSPEEAYQRGIDNDDELSDIMDEFSEEDDELDAFEDDDDVNPKFEKIITGVGIAIAVLIVILAVYVFGKAFNIFGNSKAPATTSAAVTTEANTVPMPYVVGKPKEEAEEMLKAVNLGSNCEYEYSDEYEEGYVIKQEFEEGTQVEKNTRVYLVICSKENMTKVPEDIIGMTYANAVKALAAKGLGAEKEEVFSSTVEAGVVTGASPDFGKDVPLNSTVTLYVSKGPEVTKVQVPDLYNRTQADAESLLKDAGLSLGNVSQENSDTVAEGHIIKQTVEAGSSANKGSKVGITVSLGPSVKTTTVPAVAGKTESEGKTALTNAKLSVKVETQNSDTVTSGYIISCNPAAGSSVNEGTTVTIVVSIGPGNVEIPDLRTLTAAQAKTKLEEKGLKLGNIKEDYSDTIPQGQIISQSATGTIVKGSTIDVVVSKGKKPEPTTEAPKPTEPKPTEPKTTEANPDQPPDSGNSGGGNQQGGDANTPDGN